MMKIYLLSASIKSSLKTKRRQRISKSESIRELQKKHNKNLFLFFLLSFFFIDKHQAQRTNIHIASSSTHFYIDENVLDFSASELSDCSKDVFHLITHGRSGKLLIGHKWLTPPEIATWLKNKGFIKRHLNIYGCEFGKGRQGLAAVKYLENELGISIAASNNLTGKAGDWELEIGTPIAALNYTDYPHSLQNIGGTINSYAAVTGITGNDFLVDDASSFSVGDQILIIQMQGAIIDDSNTSSYGVVTSRNGVGNFELANITTIVGNTITLSSLSKTYVSDGSVQIIKTPDYSANTLTTVTSTITAPAWDGTKGGVVALSADELQLDANIDVSFLGFRGGMGYRTSGVGNNYVSIGPDDAQKGEGVAKFTATGDRGKGFIANGGGAGTWVNTGGGGGGNYGAGGKGGIYSATGEGLGAASIAACAIGEYLVIMGGGGGAGDYNDGFITRGGHGGGIILLFINQLTGNGGNLIAEGQIGQVLVNAHGDGAAGGGAGGSIYCNATTYSGTLTVDVSGGEGGPAWSGHGDSGGGGGGSFFLKGTALPAGITLDALGGPGSTGGGGGNDPGQDGGIVDIDAGSPPTVVDNQVFTIDVSTLTNNTPFDSVLYTLASGTTLDSFSILSESPGVGNIFSINNGGGLSVSDINLLSSQLTYSLTIDVSTTSGLYSCPKGVLIQVSNSTDTDGDGINNTIDIDDDNDGILDYEELSCDYGASDNTAQTNTANAQSVSGSFTNGLASANYTIDFVGVNAAFSATSVITGNNGVHYLLNDNDADGNFSENISLTTTANSVLDLVSYGAQANTNPVTASSRDNDAQTITLTWNPTVNATVYDPDNQLDVADGSTITTGTTITQVADQLNGLATWRIDFKVNHANLFTLSVAHNHNTNNAIGLESYGINAIVCYNNDTDNDNVYNHLDLDSDADGCSDGVEANNTLISNNDITNYNTGTDANNNGLLDIFETGTTGTINYNSTYVDYAIVDSLTACLDTDNDGIGDLIDIDDDNDGVLDTDEGYCYNFIRFGFDSDNLGWKIVDGLGTDTVRHSTDVSLNCLIPNLPPSPSGGHYIADFDRTSNNTYFESPDNMNLDAQSLLGQPFSFDWINGRLDAGGSQSILALTITLTGGGLTATTEIDVTGLMNTGWNSLSAPLTAAAFGANISAVLMDLDKISIEVETVNSAVNPCDVTGEYMGVDMILLGCDNVLDTDGDGVYNHLDLDSDGDGCSDGVEASNTSVANNDIVNYNTGTDANNNGLLDVFETGTTGTINYNSTYNQYALTSFLNACTDSDNDGINDLVDIDDDNDGILDIVESPQCFYSASDITFIDATTSLTNYSTNAAYSFTELYDGVLNDIGAYGVLNTNIVNETVYQLELNIPAELSGIQVYFNYSIFNTISTTFKWQASNDATNWTDVTGVLNETQTTNNNYIYTFSQTGNKYQYYRLLGITGATYYNRIYEFVPLTDNFVAHDYPKTSCSSDTDGDGIYNHLDLDSDGDGCFDSYEASVTNATNSGNLSDSLAATLPSQVGANGLADFLETTTDSDTINYSSTYNAYALSDFLNVCTDSDNDGINDLVDIDDDNDGILDIIESPQCFYTASDITFIDATTSLTNYSTNAAYSFTELYDGVLNDIGAYGALNTNIVNETVYQLELNIPAELSGIQVYFNYSIFNTTSTTFKWQASNDATNWTDVTGVLNETQTTNNNYTYTFSQTGNKYQYYRLLGITGATYYNRIYEFVPLTDNFVAHDYPKTSCSSDTDGDGIFNHLDLDSDGDGCFDSYEASVTNATNSGNLSDSLAATLPSQVGANGLADFLETTTDSDTINYSSTYNAYALSDFLNVCTDSDNDGINDLVDIDDDNDGILDIVESPQCFYSASDITFIDATTSLTNYSTNAAYSFTELYDGVLNDIGAYGVLNTNIVNETVYQLELNIPAELSGIQVYFNYSIFNTTSTTFKWQASNDATNWTDVTGVLNETQTTNNNYIYTFSQTGNKYQYYRLLGITGATYYNRIYEFVPLTDNFVAHDYPKTSCSSDTDGDGIFNHLDLDSDGDGCFDSYEASVTNATNSGNLSDSLAATSPAQVGANGLADFLETTTDSDTINYSSTYNAYALSDFLNVCADSDNDGIGDLIDIDDDNDGILDIIESPQCFYSASDITFIDATTSLTNYSTNAAYSFTELYDGVLNDIGAYGVLNTNIVNETVYQLELNIPAELSGIQVYFNYSIFRTTATTFKWQASNDATNWTDVTGVLNETETTNNNYIYTFSQTGTKYQYYRLLGITGTTYYNRIYEFVPLTDNFVAHDYPKTSCSSDTDGDGIYNHLDLDSDGDGCFDSYEASVTNATNSSNLSDSLAATSPAQVGANGLADFLETTTDSDTINYSSTYNAYALSDFLNVCADSDNDGIGDLIDIDDDNDGILDIIESPQCFYSASDITFIDATTSLTNYSTNAAYSFTELYDGVLNNIGAYGVLNTNIVNETVYQLELNIPAELSGIQVYFNYSIFRTTATTFKWQASNDATNWTDVTGVLNETETTNNNYIYTFSQTGTKYQYYRLLGITGTTYYNRIYEFVPLTDNFVAHDYPKTSCSSDTDGDGIYNHLDLDSDGDGCSDGVEASNTLIANNDITNYNTGVDANNNGLLDTFEDGTTGNLNYIPTYYVVLDTALNACIDTDNDGLGDLVDIDDDNDGVLDITECYGSAQSSVQEFLNGDFSSLNLNNWTVSPAIGGAGSGRYIVNNDANFQVSLSQTIATYPGDVISFSVDFGSLTTNSLALDDYFIVFIDGVSVDTIPGNIGPSMTTYYFSGVTESDSTEILFLLGHTHDLNNDLYMDNVELSILSYNCTTDTDNDGIPDRLDLDSDGDGCSDGVEAGNTLAVNNDVTNYNTGTDANTNGLLDTFEDGTTGNINYNSTYLQYALSDFLNACTDTDNDGINDLIDLDDDNDGIRDALEVPNCFYQYTDFETGNRSDLVSVSTSLNMNATYTHPEETIDGDNGLAAANYAVQFLNSQSAINQTVYQFEFNTPIELSTIYIGYINGNSHFINGASIQLQASNDGVTWADLNTGATYNQANLSTPVLTVGTIQNHSFIVTQNAGTYKYYRIQGISGTIWSGGYCNEIYFETNNFVPEFHPKAACSDDTDGDGIYNHLDLDSDGDGILDIIEAGGTDSNQDGQVDYLTVGDPSTMVDVDGDGLYDAVDTVNSGSGVGEVTNGTPLLNGDSDGDGVQDIVDIDADNDGIVDNTEAQATLLYIAPAGTDTDGDGIDDAYDGLNGFGGEGISPNNQDGTDNPDYLDLDSDNDGESDLIEGHDTNGDGVVDGLDSPNANTGLSGGAIDTDADGLLDGFDNNTTSTDATNSTLTPNSHPDADNSITSEKDWREKSSTYGLDDINSTPINTTIIGDVLINDFDLEGDIQSVSGTITIDTDGDGIPETSRPLGAATTIAGVNEDGTANLNAGTLTQNSNGTYTFTPSAGFVGEIIYFYQVCDNAVLMSCDSATVTIGVEPIPTTDNSTIALSPDVNRTYGTNPVNGQVLSNDNDPDGDPIVVTGLIIDSNGDGIADLNAPLSTSTTTAGVDANGNSVMNAGIVIQNSDGTYTFTPTAGFVGTVTYQYVACDNSTPANCEQTTVTLEVLPNLATNSTNSNDDNEFIDKGQPLTDNVLENDSDVEGDSQIGGVTLVSGPTQGGLSLNADGSYTYTPNNPSIVGNDAFIYSVCDDGSPSVCDTSTVYITILDVNRDYGETSGTYPVVWHRAMRDVNADNTLDGATDVWLGMETNFENASLPIDNFDDGIAVGSGAGQFPLSVAGGQSFNLDLTVNSSVPDLVHYGLWIDWNNDGTYDQFYNDSVVTASPTTTTVTITVPNGLGYSGGSPVNVRVRSDDDAFSINDSGGGRTNGEVEDYQISMILLPVELMSFTAKLEGENTGILDWITSSETNNAGFEVEHALPSTRGVTFEKIGYVQGTGTTTQTTYYTYQVPNLMAGTHYFRIKQINLDGTYKYSSIRALTVNKSEQTIVLYPNPTTDKVSILLPTLLEGEIDIEVFDNIGQRIHTKTVSQQQVIELEFAHLPTANYMVRVKTDTSTKVFKLIVSPH
ncbi:DUF4347 domain-containing protein [Aureispira anguillae]|uniref:Ig-like domain-containing protein n=1 Tax=Aureispira anguillae TaxID=2864201 RepID=A0A916DX84_9BACT|nr:Ig-like domain-containing protein [Aureispira anguillae]BDS15612.1 Ig-like domain-containing protein [Aureispira anguillae]